MVEADQLKVLVMARVKDLVAGLLYYDRKGDEEVGLREIDRAFTEGIVTAEEVVACFEAELRRNLPA